MFFFKWRKQELPEPDLTRVRLYKGAYYFPLEPSYPTHHVYTLCEWSEGSDGDFSEVALESALSIMDNMPVVINHLYLNANNVSLLEDEEIRQYKKCSGIPIFYDNSNVLTLTNEPDRGLVDSFPHDDECYQFFSGRVSAVCNS